MSLSHERFSHTSLYRASLSYPKCALALLLDAALEKLQEKDPRKAQVVKLRYFAGLTIEEVAGALEVSTATVDRDWTYARAWLFRELGGGA